MSLLNKLASFITTEDLFHKNDKLLVGVSGGVDSIVLCELCHQAGFNFCIAHCNFQLRGEESERDEDFVRKLAERYGVEFFVKKFETESYALKNRLGIQEAARKLRYKWFDEILNQGLSDWKRVPGTGKCKPGAGDQMSSAASNRWLFLTAHHANDNIETLLMNFFRGTGISGLHGILPKQGQIRRPLLFATKHEIINFASENQLPFVEDSSNSSDKYTRNYFRNQLIPSIQKVYPRVEENLKDNIRRFKDIDILYRHSIGDIKKKLLEQVGAETHIPVLKLLKIKPLFTVVYEIIKDFNFTSNQTGEVMHLLNSDSGKFVQSPSHKIIKNRNWLIVAPNNTGLAQNILIEQEHSLISFTKGQLKIEKMAVQDLQVFASSSIATLDAKEIKFPLLLRKWKQGDYFYPLGMTKKKKLSRFFIDQKMSLTEKENTWILEMNKKIIWIIGRRIDNRFKIVPGTKNILQFSLH